MGASHTQALHLSGQRTKHLGTLLDIKTVLTKILQFLVICWDSRRIDHQTVVLVLAGLWDLVNILFIVNQNALLLQTTGQFRRGLVVTCHNKPAMIEITHQCAHTDASGTDEIDGSYILCFH